MLIAWVLVVLCMAVVVRYNTGSEIGGLFAFLFHAPQNPGELPPVVVAKSPNPPQQPSLVLPEEKPAPPSTEWTALNKGKAAGKGTLGPADVTTFDNGDVHVTFPCTSPGDYRAFYPTNVDSLSVDLIGAWKGDVFLDKRLERGEIKRVQVADHKQWVRVSGIARNARDTLDARVEYSATRKLVRIVFSKRR